jgi:hypothetical protein
MMDRIFQSLETIGPAGVLTCFIAGAIIALMLVLSRR